MSHKNSQTHLDLIIPGILWPDIGDIEGIYQEIKVPNITTLISFAKTKTLNFSYSDILYNLAFPDINGSLARQLKLQIQNKPLTNLPEDASLPDISTKNIITAILEPTYLRTDRDRLLIAETDLLQLNNDEADTINAYLNENLEDGINIYKLNEKLWVIDIQDISISYINNNSLINLSELQINPTPIVDIIGENIDDYLSSNHIAINRVLNDIQMLLFNIPINKTRKEHGELVVNSVWLWDKNLHHKIESNFNNSLYSNNPFLLESNPSIKPIDTNFDKFLENITKVTNHTIIIDSLYYPGCYRDSSSWISKFELLDQILFANLLDLLQNQKLKYINIFIPSKQNTIQLQIYKTKSWKFWYNSDLTTLATKAISMGE